MKQLFLNVKDGSVELIETPKPTVKDNTVVVETLYSTVSAGTERSLTSFGNKNLIQKSLERPDQVKKVLDKMATDGFMMTIDSAFNRLNEPMPMGYSAVGRVVECGRNVTDIYPGDLVAMAGQAHHSEVNRVNRNLVVKLPEHTENIKDFAFCALGGIALQGIHQCEVVPGETVAIIGLGLLGHITARILNAYGCDVVAYDVSEKTMGATKVKGFILSNDENAEEKTKSLTNGYGVDKVIITAATTSNGPMDLAAKLSRDRGIICMVGVTDMNIDRRLYFEKELTFKIARSYGPGRYDSSYEEKGIDYPIGYVRFTEGRNLEEFVRLIAQNRMSISDLITHVVPFNEAESAYEMITTNKNDENYIGIVFKYNSNEDKFKSKIVNMAKKHVNKDKVSIGLIGAGNFVRNTMLPFMDKNDNYYFKGIATTGGNGIAQTQKMFPFEYCTNNFQDILIDESIDLVVISTQHNSHAKFIIEALKAGKNVYCEKPMCLEYEDVRRIQDVYSSSGGELFIGLNRRFSDLIREIKKELKTNTIPAVYEYVVNAGKIPNDHWTQDEKSGGGRLIGEAVHFIDTIQSLDESELLELNVTSGGSSAYPMNDNAIITLKFASGAIGNIIYTAMGSKKYPKEQMRVFSNGMVYELDNYVKVNKYGSSKKSTVKLIQDKGFVNEYRHIYDVVCGKEINREIIDAFKSHELLLDVLNQKRVKG